MKTLGSILLLAILQIPQQADCQYLVGYKVQTTYDTTDNVRPAPIALLCDSVGDGTMYLRWTAVGDDSLVGTAASYDLRYSTRSLLSENLVTNGAFPLNVSGWTLMDGPGALSQNPDTFKTASGSLELTNGGSQYCGAYYTITTTATDSAFVSFWFYSSKSGDFDAFAMNQDNIILGGDEHLYVYANTWTFVSFGRSLSGGQTEIRVGINWLNGVSGDRFFIDDFSVRIGREFSFFTEATGEQAPSVSGTSESFTLSGLTNGTLYYVAIKSTDEAGNVSAASNVVTGTPVSSADPDWLIDSSKAYADDFSGLTTFHVKIGGNDALDGTSIANAWATIGRANSTLAEGQRVLIHAGVYTQKIAPVNSGSAGLPIVYQNYSTDVCSIRVTSGFAVDVQDVDYICLVGLAIEKPPYTGPEGYGTMYFSNADHCLVKDCRVWGGATYNRPGLYGAWIANEFKNVQYLRLINNYFDRRDANVDADSSRGECVEINGTDSKYCIVEGNTVTNTSHYGLSIPTGTGSSDCFISVRNNVSYNNHCGGGNNYTNRRVMYEGNRFFQPGQILLYKDGQSLEVIGSYGIYRFNMLYDDGAASAALMSETVNNLFLSGSNVTMRNAIYGNAFMGNSQNNKLVYAFSAYNDADDLNFGQILKNNIIAYPNDYPDVTAYFWQNQMTGFQAMDTVGSNAFWTHEAGDFVATLNNITSDHFYTLPQMKSDFPTLWNAGNLNCTPVWVDSTTTGLNRSFELAATSPLIDAGEALTVVASNVSSSSIVPVGNAGYFHYDWGASPYDRGDSVLIGTVRAEIDSVDYTNNRIITKSVVSVSAGAAVHILATYETARGYIRRLLGSAPDIGPYERP